MKVILNNGVELAPIIIIGEKNYFQNANRDCLKFVFDDCSMDEIDGLFTEANCEKINTIGDDGTEKLYEGYAIRVGMEKTVEQKENATATTPAEYVKRVSVTMAERTYAETKLAEIESQNMDTAMAVAELGVLLAGGME